MLPTLPNILFHQGLRYPETIAQLSKDRNGVFQPTTYKELLKQILDFAGALKSLGAEKNDHIGHICDDRQEWQVISLGSMTIGAADIPRGTDVTVKELSYILGFAECKIVCVENAYVLGKICDILDELPLLQHIVLIDDSNYFPEKFDLKKVKLHFYSNLLKDGAKWRSENFEKVEQLLFEGKPDDVATIIFTSGTTGIPKGVELTHKNFICQLEDLAQRLKFHKADRCLCVLPIWHVYQRTMENYVFYFAGTLCYSKPVSSVLLSDFEKIRPQFFPCVPRIWESLYQVISKKIKKDSKTKWLLFQVLSACSTMSLQLMDTIKERKRSFKKPSEFKHLLSQILWIPYSLLLGPRLLGEKLFYKKLKTLVGGQFIAGISGGGGLPAKLDKFFNAIGIKLLEGYGLTETAPMVALRDINNPMMETIGRPLGYCQVKIVDDEGKTVEPGTKGVLLVKGDNVMKGYYKQPELTAQAVDKDGWFNTGDIAMQTYTGELVIKGRKKDTIVLKSGENVEPFPIEAKLSESPYISQAIVVGQDENSLGALIIPDIEAIRQAAKENERNGENRQLENNSKLLSMDFSRELILREFERLICAKNGFKNFERVNQFVFLEKLEHPQEEISAKGGLIRYKINQNYKHLIDAMFNREEKKQRKLTDIIQNLL